MLTLPIAFVKMSTMAILANIAMASCYFCMVMRGSQLRSRTASHLNKKVTKNLSMEGGVAWQMLMKADHGG